MALWPSIACGAVAVAFRASSRVLGAGFKRLENPPNTFSTSSSDGAFVGYPRVPRAWHAPLGGFVFGVASLLFPEVTYQGFDNVNSMLGADGGPNQGVVPQIAIDLFRRLTPLNADLMGLGGKISVTASYFEVVAGVEHQVNDLLGGVGRAVVLPVKSVGEGFFIDGLCVIAIKIRA